MEESVGQQYALQVAVQTMKERCLQLQQRLSIVEEENLHLRMKCVTTHCLELTDDKTKTEIEVLRDKVTQLSKQKSQLTHNVLMVATENRHLWNRLSKLTQANQSLGNQLTKINDSLGHNVPSPPLVQPSNLIRNRTFTHETRPPRLVPKLDKDVYVDSSLEDISLKILNNIAQEKSELEKQVIQMAEMQNNEMFLQNSIGFAYPNDQLDENIITEITQNLEKLKNFKELLLMHREKLKNGIDLFKKIYSKWVPCKICEERKLMLEMKNKKESPSTSHADVELLDSPKKSIGHFSDEIETICPMCSRKFSVNEPPTEFVTHVQSHFTTDNDSYNTDVLNFEIVDTS